MLKTHGAHLRIIASMLTCRAALRYFKLSSRNEEDIVDISRENKIERQRLLLRVAFRSALTIERVSSPKQVLHVFGHDTSSATKSEQTIRER